MNAGRDRDVVLPLLNRALDDEPLVRLDLDQVRRDGRRLRRRNRARSGVAALATAAVVTGIVLAMPWAGTAPGASPAGEPPASAAPAATASGDPADERAAQQAEHDAAVDRWRAHAVAAVAGALRRDALGVPVEGVDPVHPVEGPQGEDLGTEAWLVVDVVGVGDGTGVPADVHVEIRNGYLGTGGMCGRASMACNEERADDGAVLRRGEGLMTFPSGSELGALVGGEPLQNRVVQVVRGSTMVEVWSTGAVSDDGTTTPPPLTLDQLEAVATAPFWQTPPPA